MIRRAFHIAGPASGRRRRHRGVAGATRIAAAGLVVGLATLLVGVLPAPVGASAGPTKPAAIPSWPQLGYGPARTGYQPDEKKIGAGNVHKLSLARTYAPGGISTPPVIADGILYVAADSELYAFDATGTTDCSAAHPASCTALWTASVYGADGLAVADGIVFVTASNSVEAFDASGSDDDCSGTPKVCSPLWTTSRTAAYYFGSGSPVVADGVLYVPGYGDGLAPSLGGAYVLAFDAAGSTDCSGLPKVCAPMWTTVGVPTSEGNAGSPAVANGVLYIATGKLLAFDAAGSKGCSGTPKVCAAMWTSTTSMSYTYSAPSVSKGTVYVGSYSGLYAFDGAGKTNCSVSGGVKTCTPLWKDTSTGSILGTPAVANGVVFNVSGGGSLLAFNAAGKTNCSVSGGAKTCTPLWTSAAGLTGYVTWTSPAVANGVVYFLSTDGQIYAYDAAGSTKDCSVSGGAKTCAPLWRSGAVPIGAADPSSPAVANGVVSFNSPWTGEIYSYSL